ncbi:MAG: DUF1194 domain-containing protein [Pikeienuella sp.]
MSRLSKLATLVAALISITAPARACGVELVLAMDISRSVSRTEFRLQVDGLADAFRDPEVRQAIKGIPGGVLTTVMIWGDSEQQRQTAPWTLLQGGEETEGFANLIQATPRTFAFTLTGLGAAMLYADRLTKSAPIRCNRRVIDISGDGVWNHGPRPSAAWASGMSRDVTVNGLVILGATPNPLNQYQLEVIGGPGAFVEVADDFDDYALAIRRKLLRELAPAFVMLTE